MILIELFYLWTNLLQITLCVTPATMLVLANIENQKAKALAAALTWKMKNNYNTALGKSKFNNFFGDRNFFKDRFIRDVSNPNINIVLQNSDKMKEMSSIFFNSNQNEHLNTKNEQKTRINSDIYPQDNSNGIYNLNSQLPYYENESPDYIAPEMLYPENIPDTFSIEELQDMDSYDNEMMPRTHLPLETHLSSIPPLRGLFPYRHFITPSKFSKFEIVSKPCCNDNTYLHPIIKQEYKTSGYDNGEDMVGTAHLLHFTPINQGTPLYQNPSHFDSLKPENRQKIIKFIELKDKPLEFMLDILKNIAYHFNGPKHLPHPEHHKYAPEVGYMDKIDQIIIPSEDNINQEYLTPTIPPEQTPYKQNIIQSSYHKHKKNIKSEIKSYSPISTDKKDDPNFYGTDADKFDAFTPTNIAESSIPMENYQKYSPSEYSFDQKEVSNFFKDQFDQLDRGLNVIGDDINRLEPIFDPLTYSQLISDELQKLRDATEKYDIETRESSQNQRVSEAPPEEYVHRPEKSHGENLDDPIVSHIIKVPINYHYWRTTREAQSNKTADEYLNALLNEGREMLTFLKKIGSQNQDILTASFLGNTLIDNIQGRLNITSSRSKRNVPLETLIMDPKIKIDTDKLLENLGTCIKILFNHKDTPFYHVRNIFGSTKDVVMATLKIPNQNFLVPTEYNIVDNPNKDETILNTAYPDLSSRFGNYSDEDPQWAEKFVQSTFHDVGNVIRNVVKSSHEAVHHVSEITNHAKKAILTAKQTPDILMQTVDSIPLISDQKKINLNSRFGNPEEDLIVGKAKSQAETKFVNVGHLLDAIGISNPATGTQNIAPRFTDKEYKQQFWNNIDNVVQKSNTVKTSTDLFPLNNNLQDVLISKSVGNIEKSVKQAINNIKDVTKTQNQQLISKNSIDKNVKKILKNIEAPLSDFIPMKKTQDFSNLRGFSQFQNKNDKSNGYFQQAISKLDDINPFNDIQNSVLSKSGPVQKVWNKLEDIGTTSILQNKKPNLLGYNVGENKNYFQKNKIDDSVNEIDVDDVHEFILGMKKKLKDLKKNNHFDINCLNTRIRRNVNDQPLKADNLVAHKESFSSERFTENGMNLHDQTDAEQVSTPFIWTPDKLTPFMGLADENKKQKFFSQYVPTVSYDYFFNENVNSNICSGNDYVY